MFSNSLAADFSLQDPQELLIQNLVKNLSCFLSNTHLDIIHSGIQIYDPFLIQDSVEKSKKIHFSPVKLQAISLRSKSTRNLHIRNPSFSSLLKSFQSGNKANETAEIELLENMNKSRSRSFLTQVKEKQRKSSYETKGVRKILQDVYNMKGNKSAKKNLKKNQSRRSQGKLSRFASMTPNKRSTNNV